MKKILIIFLIFSFVGIPVIGEAQKIDLDQIDLDKLPNISFGENNESISPNSLLDSFGDLYELSKKIKNLILKVWNVAGGFVEEVTGFTLSEVITKLINVSIGIITTMIELLTKLFEGSV